MPLYWHFLHVVVSFISNGNLHVNVGWTFFRIKTAVHKEGVFTSVASVQGCNAPPVRQTKTREDCSERLKW